MLSHALSLPESKNDFMPGIGRLTGTVKHYDWGGTVFIPLLLNMDNKDGKPFAEYWLGVHPQAHCKVEIPGGPATSLQEFINTSPEQTLGPEVFHRFGNLPYLLKTLDVKDMLSIQVHPSKAVAEKYFSEENSKGISRDAAHRNYKDDNHKPELLVAMGEFWLLHGFKPDEKMNHILSSVKELNFLLDVFRRSGYEGLYKKVMEMPQAEVNETLKALLDRIIPLYQSGKLEKNKEDFWAARAALTFSRSKDIDRGIFSVYLFNLVQLRKGQAVFQDAGVPHAYLEGQNVEIMASSDNVLRGGLTTKHIDVQELLKHVKCEPTHVDILDGEKQGKKIVYKTIAPDFELSAFDLKANEMTTIDAESAEILLLIDGEAELKVNEKCIQLKKGLPSAIIFAGQSAELLAKETALIFKASVPRA
jgi:mannose-6-phosphate isomerase